MLDKVKLISLQGLSLFLTNIQTWVENKLKSIDTKIERQIFQGTQAELEIAIKEGLVDENTLIILTDTDEPPVYQFCTYQDILAMFPEYA